MLLILALIGLLTLYGICRFIYSLITRKHRAGSPNTVQRFKRTFTGRSRLIKKITENTSNKLMNDPKENINIGNWDNEEILREKADIHRARLRKYGFSKMNDEMLYADEKGSVYKLNSDGSRLYV